MKVDNSGEPAGKVVVGGVYYFIVHAYHHFIAEVVEITGRREVVVGPQAWIYSCRRDWTKFFRDGALKDTTSRTFPPGQYEYLAAFRWKHPIPEDRQ
jgi:hypothetical protein